jgi:hypothetical protein
MPRRTAKPASPPKPAKWNPRTSREFSSAPIDPPQPHKPDHAHARITQMLQRVGAHEGR